MLIQLQIKDYALIDNLTIDFQKGLNIITGETGAGKSILIGALGLLLGSRASTELVRKGAKKSVIEGVFEIEKNSKVLKLLDELEIDSEDELIVRREISLKGSNRCFINDTPVNLNNIKEIGDFLIDLHGQHDHQSLLNKETHIELLDDYGDYNVDLKTFHQFKSLLEEKRKSLNELLNKEEDLKQKKDFWEFQINEIDNVTPIENEEENLEANLNILENSEKLMEITSGLYARVYESENSVHDNLVQIKNDLLTLSGIDKSFDEKLNDFEQALSIINDIAIEIGSYKDNIDLDESNLEEIRQRLNALSMLKKKYGKSLKEIIDYRVMIGEEFEIADNYSGKIEQLQNEIRLLQVEGGEICERLSNNRKTIAQELETQILEILKELEINDARFSVDFKREITQSKNLTSCIIGEENYSLNEFGIDTVEFLISTNFGEDLKPLVKIASGGEISRIMLALKTLLAKSDKLPLLVFDEIDTGVSGRIAQKVGNSLKSLAKFHQIIAITHLPQIAGLADLHFLVEKNKSEERVISNIRRLAEEERVVEVAKLMSGSDVSEASLDTAKELMGIK